SGDDRAKYVVRRGEHCFAILNKYPYNNGHLMVAPFRHVPSIEELNEAELLELMTLTQESLAALREAYQPEGFNLGVNQGKIAGPASPMRVALGRDMRLSAPALAARYADGLRDEGAEVLDIGMVGTEMLYFAVGSRPRRRAHVHCVPQPEGLHGREARAPRR